MCVFTKFMFSLYIFMKLYIYQEDWPASQWMSEEWIPRLRERESQHIKKKQKTNSSILLLFKRPTSLAWSIWSYVGTGQDTFFIILYYSYYSFSSKSRRVALLFNKNLQFKLDSTEKNESGRFVLIDCVINLNKMTLVSLYGPNIDDPVFFNDLIIRRWLKFSFKSTNGSLSIQSSNSP